ncbi:MAG: hypothetical protein JW807_03750 [Spirochaetes bacterium]|nr:hypothetical protein [Spirochaetota bacterium]
MIRIPRVLMVCAGLVLTGCLTYHKVQFDVPAEKSDEAWSRGISWIVRAGTSPIGPISDYYVATCRETRFVGTSVEMFREVYQDKTRIFIAASSMDKTNPAEQCMDYILENKILYSDVPADSNLVKKDELIKKYNQAQVPDIPAPVINELLKTHARDEIAKKLEKVRVSGKELRGYSLDEVKKLLGLD